MAIVTFYRGHPNPPKTTMPARLGANAIITCKGKLLLEKRKDSDIWGLVGGGVKKNETEICHNRYRDLCGRPTVSNIQFSAGKEGYIHERSRDHLSVF